MTTIYGQICTKWPLDEKEQAILEQMKEPMEAFVLEAQQAAAVVQDNPSFGILLVRSSAVPFKQFRAMLDDFLDYQQQKMLQAEAESDQQARRISAAIIVFALLITLVAILTTFFISDGLISRPILAMTGLMGSLAGGDLSIEVSGLDHGDEIGAMARAVDVFRVNAIQKAEAEAALRASEANYRAIFDAANDVIFVHDIETGNIVDVNQKMCDLYGYTADEARHLNIEAVSAGEPPYSQADAMQWVNKAAEGPAQVFEWLAKTKVGEFIWVEVSLKRANIGGEDRLLAVVRDISERKEAQDALKAYSDHLQDMVEQRTQQLQAAQEQLVRREKLAVLGQLAGGVAHELRNPLGVISNSVYYLRTLFASEQQLADSRTEEIVGEYLQMMAGEVDNAEGIISDLLDFSRTQQANREVLPVSFLLTGLFEKRPPPEGVETFLEIAPDLPPVLVDPFQINVVLHNLVTNAYQAMPEGGRVTVVADAANQHQPASDSESQIHIRVSDTGSGIPPENLEKVFEALFTTKARGIGLGLALSKNLVEANGGSIEVDSQPGKGSVFTVRLPAVE